jgi:hypothetical protein
VKTIWLMKRYNENHKENQTKLWKRPNKSALALIVPIQFIVKQEVGQLNLILSEIQPKPANKHKSM